MVQGSPKIKLWSYHFQAYQHFMLTVDYYISAKISTYILWPRSFHCNLLHSPLPPCVLFLISNENTLFNFQTMPHDLLYKEIEDALSFT